MQEAEHVRLASGSFFVGDLDDILHVVHEVPQLVPYLVYLNFVLHFELDLLVNVMLLFFQLYLLFIYIGCKLFAVGFQGLDLNFHLLNLKVEYLNYGLFLLVPDLFQGLDGF